jgi:hypothetical protein
MDALTYFNILTVAVFGKCFWLPVSGGCHLRADYQYNVILDTGCSILDAILTGL